MITSTKKKAETALIVSDTNFTRRTRSRKESNIIRLDATKSCHSTDITPPTSKGKVSAKVARKKVESPNKKKITKKTTIIDSTKNKAKVSMTRRPNTRSRGKK